MNPDGEGKRCVRVDVVTRGHVELCGAIAPTAFLLRLHTADGSIEVANVRSLASVVQLVDAMSPREVHVEALPREVEEIAGAIAAASGIDIATPILH
jgi:NAD(P)H-dependent FMN reductase